MANADRLRTFPDPADDPAATDPSATDPSATDPSAAVRIRVHTFGACAIDVNGTRLGRHADTLIALVLVLVHAPGMQMARDDLMELLWPDSPDARRRGSLRQALYKLRQLGVRAAMNGDQVELDATQVDANFSTERTAARFESDVLRGSDPFGLFLPGFTALRNTRLDEWLDDERQRAHSDVRRVLAAALRTRHAAADWHGAEPLARWLLQFDPLNEAATLVLAECLVLSGAKHDAIALLDRYMSELGPGAEELRLPATTLRRRISAPALRRLSFAPTERHFFGREGVMAQLTLAMRRARFNDGSATLLHGPAGMGKTRLVGELGKVAVLEGVRDVRGGCRETDVGRPLSVFLELVPELLQMSGALGCSPESMQALRRFANEDAAEPDRAHATRQEATMPLAAALRRSIVDLIAAVSDEKPMLIVIEDVHWLDAASWEVFVDLIERIGELRVCLILTSRLPHARPTPPAREAIALRREALEPLSRESCLELARAIGTDLSASIDDVLGEWFVHSSEGVPLFLRSLVNHWIETGDAGGIPPTLVEAIGQRLRSLSPDALSILQTVALLAPNADLSTVEAALEFPYYRFVSALHDLHKVGAFYSDGNDKLSCHELIGRMAVDGLGESVRRSLHLRIASVLLQGAGDVVLPAVQRRRLEHLLQSGDVQRFLRASVDAARELLRAGFSYDALWAAEGALEHVEDARMRTTLLELQAEALYSCGEYARLLSHPLSPVSVGQGLKHWEQREPEALIRWLDSAAYADRGSNASDLGAAAILIAEHDRYSSQVRFSAATLAIRIASNTYEEDLALRAYEAGRCALATLADEEVRANELDMLYHTCFGDSARALDSAHRALGASRNIHSTTERMLLQLRIGFALQCCGDVYAAHNLLEQIHHESVSEGLAPTFSIAAWRLSILHLEQDELAAADHWLARYADVAPIDREPLAATLFHAHSARIALAHLDVSAAELHVRKAEQTLPESGHPMRHAALIANKLGLARLRGDANVLGQLVNEAWPIYLTTRAAVGQCFFTTELGLGLFSVGQTEQAARIVTDYVVRYRREPSPLPAYFRRAAAAVGAPMEQDLLDA